MYNSDEVLKALEKSGATKPACSAFFTRTLDGNPLTCRNFDKLHQASAGDPTPTGLNVVLHCALPGKYESIAVGDAVYCDEGNPLLTCGAPTRRASAQRWWTPSPTSAWTAYTFSTSGDRLF